MTFSLGLLHPLVIPCCRYGLPRELPFLRLHLLGERYHPALGSEPDLQPSNPRSVLPALTLSSERKETKMFSVFVEEVMAPCTPFLGLHPCKRPPHLLPSSPDFSHARKPFSKGHYIPVSNLHLGLSQWPFPGYLSFLQKKKK